MLDLILFFSFFFFMLIATFLISDTVQMSSRAMRILGNASIWPHWTCFSMCGRVEISERASLSSPYSHLHLAGIRGANLIGYLKHLYLLCKMDLKRKCKLLLYSPMEK